MKYIYFFLPLCLFFTCCVGTKKYNRYVLEQLKYERSENIPQINFSYTGDVREDSVKVSKQKSYFIPAIFYWGIRNTILCEINPQVYADYFQERFKKYSQELGLLERLNGRRLDISLDYMPSSFVYDFSSQSFIFVFAYVTTGYEKIIPENGYRPILLKYAVDAEDSHDRVVGDMTMNEYQEPLTNVWKSTKGFTKHYMNTAKSGIDNMAKNAVLQILENVT